jgi:iron complex outermembrane receptor protein
MSNVYRRSMTSAAVAAVLASTSPLVFAQGAGLEEILVTAERRETSLQKTPISVAAFTAESMELKGVETLEDIATLTPNLDIKGSRGTGNVNPTYQIRGLSGGGGLAERSAAMYIDGVFMPRTTGPYMNVLDIERIEVLRGPQGTLFGRNSTGGAIRVFTRQPGPDQEGYVRLATGNFDRADLSAMINVPLSDTVFFRAQGGSLSQDGYVRRGSQELGGAEDTLGRVQLAVEPSDELKVTFSLSSTESESDGNPQDLETFDMRPDLNFQGNRADWVSDFLEAAGQPRINPDNDSRIVLDDFTLPDWCFLDDADPDWDAACEQFNESEYRQFDVNVSWSLSERWTLTSITGLSNFESRGISDWVMLGTEARHQDVESDVVYEELQFNAAFDRFDLVTGFSYFQEDVYGSPGTGSPNYDRRGTSAFPAAANGNGVAVGSGPNGLFVTVVTDGLQDSQSVGAFANVTWHVTDRLNITPGVRYALDEKAVTETRFPADDFTPFGGAPSTRISAEDDWDNTDWRLTLDYQVTENHMLYATSSEAFRSGAYSYNIAATSSGAAQTQAIASGLVAAFTPPERVRNDEIGARTEWLDGRLRVNLTYFDMAYTNRQGPIQIADLTSPTGFRIQLVNTGDVDLSGYELEGQIAATESFMVDFSAGLIDPTLSDPCANNGDFLFPGPVEDSYSVGARWTKAFERGGGLTVGLTFAYTGPQETHPGGTTIPCFNAITGAPNVLASGLLDSRYELPGYSLVNGRVRYTSADGMWELALFGNNLTDEVYGNFATRFGGAFWDTPTGVGAVAAPQRSALGITRGRPREYGVSFQYNFGGGASARR